LTRDLDTLGRARLLSEAALDQKALDLLVIDVRGLTSFADAFILATATSDRHAKAVADAVTKTAKEAGFGVMGTEGYDEGRWILIDIGDLIVHVFQEETRTYYDLERLWADAPRVDVEATESPEAHGGRA